MGCAFPPHLIFPVLDVLWWELSSDESKSRETKSPGRPPHTQARRRWPGRFTTLSLIHKTEKQQLLQRMVVRTKWKQNKKPLRWLVQDSVNINPSWLSTANIRWNKLQKWQLLHAIVKNIFPEGRKGGGWGTHSLGYKNALSAKKSKWSLWHLSACLAQCSGY